MNYKINMLTVTVIDFFIITNLMQYKEFYVYTIINLLIIFDFLKIKIKKYYKLCFFFKKFN